MRARSLLTVAALALLAAGCGVATPYQPLNLEGGYASTRLGVDTFNVLFQGNAHTPWATAESYALYRSAELTVEAGYDYFVVLGGTVDAVALRRAASDPTPLPAGLDTDRPNVAITFRAFSGTTPSPQAFNAREVIAQLAPSIKRR